MVFVVCSFLKIKHKILSSFLKDYIHCTWYFFFSFLKRFICWTHPRDHKILSPRYIKFIIGSMNRTGLRKYNIVPTNYNAVSIQSTIYIFLSSPLTLRYQSNLIKLNNIFIKLFNICFIHSKINVNLYSRKLEYL